jgi:hypothetical protein
MKATIYDWAGLTAYNVSVARNCVLDTTTPNYSSDGFLMTHRALIYLYTGSTPNTNKTQARELFKGEEVSRDDLPYALPNKYLQLA